jgi:hypothetical protein
MEALKSPGFFYELSKDELSKTYGGFWYYILGGIALAISNGVIIDWDNFKAGLRGEPEIPKCQ